MLVSSLINICVSVCVFIYLFIFAYCAHLGSPTGSTIRLKRSLNIEEDQLAEPFIAEHPFLWLLRHDATAM